MGIFKLFSAIIDANEKACSCDFVVHWSVTNLNVTCNHMCNTLCEGRAFMDYLEALHKYLNVSCA